MFLHRTIDLLSRPESANESFTICVMGTGTICACESPASLMGSSVWKAAFSKSLARKLSESMMTTPPLFTWRAFVFKAAGFMATNTSAKSPGV